MYEIFSKLLLAGNGPLLVLDEKNVNVNSLLVYSYIALPSLTTSVKASKRQRLRGNSLSVLAS